MKRFFICLIPLMLVVPAWADFIAVGFDGGRVARINELTGTSQIIGFTSSDAALTASLTRDPLTGTFYTVGGLESGGVRRLFTLDPNTGQTALVAPLSQNLSIQALAAAPTGGSCMPPVIPTARCTPSTRAPAKFLLSARWVWA